MTIFLLIVSLLVAPLITGLFMLPFIALSFGVAAKAESATDEESDGYLTAFSFVQSAGSFITVTGTVYVIGRAAQAWITPDLPTWWIGVLSALYIFTILPTGDPGRVFGVGMALWIGWRLLNGGFGG